MKNRFDRVMKLAQVVLVAVLTILLLTAAGLQLPGTGTISFMLDRDNAGAGVSQSLYFNRGSTGTDAELSWNETLDRFEWNFPISGDPQSDQFSYIMAGQILEVATTPPLILAWITPATTEADLSGNSNDATYNNFVAGDQGFKAFVWGLSFYTDNDEYLNVGDDPGFSWDDSGAAPWSVCVWIEVVETAAIQTVIAKYDVQGTDREWKIILDAAEKMELALFDEADDKESTNITDAALSAGWHFVVHTYDSTGGATALSDTNSIWYVDGVVVAESQTNDGDYTNMVAGATDVTIGGYNTGAAVANFFQGDMGALWIEDVELGAAQVWAYYVGTRGFYNE